MKNNEKLLNIIGAGMLFLAAEGCATVSGIKPPNQNDQKAKITAGTQPASTQPDEIDECEDESNDFAQVGYELVMQNRNEFKLCFNRALKTDPEAGGKLSVKTVVMPDGSVEKVSFGDSSTVTNERLRNCVSSITMGWRFPETKQDKPRIMEFPIIFQAGE